MLNMKDKINIIDLFAGCGGLSDGFEQTGKYRTLACVDWEKLTCDTLAYRLKHKWGYKNANNIVLHYDIQQTENLINGWLDDPIYGTSEGLDKIVEKSKKNIDVIIGGPPCQAYSIAGRIRDKNGMNDDYRNFLFESYLKVVDYFRPKLFVFENVPGLLSAEPGGISIVKRIMEAFEQKGYEIVDDLRKYALIDCTKFGIPQSRRRIIIIGVDKECFANVDIQKALRDLYTCIIPQYYSKQKTVKDAIGNLPKLYPLKETVVIGGKRYSHNYVLNGIENHTPRMHNKRDMEIFRILAEDIQTGRMQYEKIDAIKELYFKYTGKKSNIHKYHVLRWDMPSNTIPAHLYKDGLRHIHPDPEQMRSITVREAARLQSFDDDFIFKGSITDQYKMIGNAVPPKFAKAIAQSVYDFVVKYLKL